MSLMDKFLNVMKLNDEDENDYYDTEDEIVESTNSNHATSSSSHDTGRKIISNVTPMRSARRTTSSGMEVCVIKPTTMEDAKEITDTLLADRTVVLNLEGLDVEIAQRIVDFTSGSCFAIKGSLQKISYYIFIITPPSVDISGDFQEILQGTVNVPNFNE